MARFKDAKGREWEITIDVNHLRKVRERLQCSLGKFDQVNELAADPIKLVDVLYMLCADQAKRDNTTPEQFGRLMVGDALGDAFDALQDAYLDFCPSRQREADRALLAKTRKLMADHLAALLAKIAAIDAPSPSTTSSATPGSSAESAESAPTVPASPSDIST